jgi:hypothetical protein
MAESSEYGVGPSCFTKGDEFIDSTFLMQSRLNSGNACRRSVQYLLSYSLLSENITLHVVLYGCEAWCLSLRVVFEKMVLMEYLETRRMK